jgi:cell division transport system permease protein
MTSREEKYYRRRVNSSYITSVISISLVLFTLGFLGLVVLHAGKLSQYIRENIGFEIIMKQDTREAEIVYLQKMLDTKPYVKSTEYITREEAAARLTEMLGDDFISFLGDDENPLLPSIDVRFKADWANNDSLAVIERSMLENEQVKEVYYQKSLVHLINSNVKRISLILAVLGMMLLLIAVALISNTIRLMVYSKRFIIRSMQLVGATRSFIRRPFILKSIWQGILSAIIALAMLTAVIAMAVRNMPELQVLTSPSLMAYLYLFVLMLGILVSGFSTRIAVSRYLSLRTDKLYG